MSYTEFSLPSYILFPHRIIMKKKTIALLGDPASYSLATLMHHKRFRTIIDQRSYGNALDKVFETNMKGSNMKRRPVKAEPTFKMLLKDRISYFINSLQNYQIFDLYNIRKRVSRKSYS